MKIAMIGHKRIPSREGGIEIVVEELAVRMAAGHRVDVYNRGSEHVAGSKYSGSRKKLREYRGVRLISIPTPNNRTLNAFVYSFLATVRALFGGYDVIHYHAEGPCAMMGIARLFGIRTVATIHGLDWQRGKWGGFASRYLLFGEKIAARYADEVIVLSENVRDYFQKRYGRDTHHIPNAVNAPNPLPPAVIREKYRLEKNSYILFLARLVPEKGLHYLLEAFRALDTDKNLVVAGGTSHSDAYVEQITALADADERVIMTGFVQGEELVELYSNCFLYVLPSDVEGMPLTLLEAMSFGCRCLVSDIRENTEAAGPYAATFAKSDIVSLRAALEQALDGRTVFHDSGEVSGHCLPRYNWDDITRRTLLLYSGTARSDRII